MREIKFRGKTYEGKWVYGDLGHESDGEPYIFYWDERRACIEENVIPETIGQYTGLKDKNGVKIYEGDIISGFLGVNGLVFFDVGFLVEYLEDAEHNTNKKGTRIKFEKYYKTEVIGNIHDK